MDNTVFILEGALYFPGRVVPKSGSLRGAMAMRAVLYGRVSTSNSQNPEMQVRDFKEYVGHRGWKIAGQYIDEGFSGAKARRPELDRLMADAHRRKFDVVVVWKFDRFARSVSHLLRALETFNALGIAFVSLGEQIDTSTPAGKMVFTVPRRGSGVGTESDWREGPERFAKCESEGQTSRQATAPGTDPSGNSAALTRQKKGGQFQETCARPWHFRLDGFLSLQSAKDLKTSFFSKDNQSGD
jgi:hypothetical protein